MTEIFAGGAGGLAIDCGSTSTTAVAAWPDGNWTPLLFDGEPELPSAVLLAPNGAMLTGHQAWQAAASSPERFVPAPRRSPEQHRITVADTEVDVVDLVAATLRRVADQVYSTVGARVEDVRLVVPAGWGPRRRTWLRRAALRGSTWRIGVPRVMLWHQAGSVRVISGRKAFGTPCSSHRPRVPRDVSGRRPAPTLKRRSLR